MEFSGNRFVRSNLHLLIVSSFSFLLVYISSFVKGYGYFIDEFYYIACASRPAMGYVDHPPLAPLVLTIFQFFFGDSVFAIRILPSLALAASVFLTGIITRELGGKKFSQLLAACAMAACPIAVAASGFYSMNAFEPVLALALIYLIIKMIKENDQKKWIWAGVVMGLGLMNKHTFGLFIAVLVISLLITGKWKLIVNKWFLFGCLCAFLIFLPNIIWQILNDYPSLEFYRNISKYKNVYTPPSAFLITQITTISPSLLLLWLSGVVYLLVSKRVKQFRFVSVLFIILFLLMMFTGTSRPDRLLFAYPGVFAGGALFFESIIEKYNIKWLKGILVVLTFVGLFIALPIILPYFNYDFVSSYTKKLGINTEMERGKKPPLPQLLADRIGWEEKFNMVLNAYNSLPEEDKRQVIIGAGNYGQAGAIELFGKKYNLPFVASGHNTYYLWSKDNLQGKNILLQLDDRRSLPSYKEVFGQVDVWPQEFVNSYVSGHENHLKVFICRYPNISTRMMLDRGKFYY
ncbi:MAG: glycosyltransferase family 39 protein [Bacteroidota bacterium]|nr:glycosyltransferase family 39 protein [Bacteroidota bacterium]